MTTGQPESRSQPQPLGERPPPRDPAPTPRQLPKNRLRKSSLVLLGILALAALILLVIGVVNAGNVTPEEVDERVPTPAQ